MHKKLLFIFIFFFCSKGFAALPYKIPGITFPLDDRSWVLVYPLLPHGQEEVWFMPEKESQNEFIIVKFYPPETEFDYLVPKKSDPAQSKVYVQKRDNNRAVNAVHVKADDRFHINTLLKGQTQIYEIHYISPGKQITEDNRLAWIKRLCQAKEALGAHGNWLHVTSNEATQNQTKIKCCGENLVYSHSNKGFSVNFPQPWALSEDYTPMPEIIDGYSFTNHLAFSRGDKLIMGNIAIAEQLGNAFNWNRIMKYLRRDFNLHIVTSGAITTFDGLNGNFIVFKENEERLVWRAFYNVEELTYLLELSIHPNNYTTTKKEIYDLLKSFSLKSTLSM